VFTRILVPLDGSELAEQVLPHVETLADKFGSTVMLLRATTGMLGADVVAGEPVPISDPTLVERERLEAASYLAALAERLRRSVLAVEHEWAEGSAAEVILERARHGDVDLIAMATHGRGGLERLVLGSVADAVLRHAPCPVLLVRAREPS
jgi:nucleotide-binding universal stress UspA family protein